MENSVLQQRAVGTRRSKANRLKFIIAGLLIVSAMAVLAMQSFQSSAMFYLTVPELRAEAATEGDGFYARQVRISGALHTDSIDWNAKAMNLKFHITEGGDMLPVEYNGVMPDTFHHSETVVAEGRFTREGVFQATTILVKCPSKYETEQGSGSL